MAAEGSVGVIEAKKHILDLLQKSLTDNDNAVGEVLETYVASLPGGDSDRRNVLDLAMREYLLQLQTNDQINPLEHIEPLLVLSVQLGQKDICNAMMPIVLLSDAFDAMTIDQCEILFHFVENGVHIWKQEVFFTAVKNTLLRMCNDLLRRLSRSQNTVFCGRILLFLAKFFPFSERSGLNILSEFNLENLTTYGENDDATVAMMDSEEEGEIIETEGPRIDYNLYCKFWNLQDFFRNPNQCYSKVPWKTFVAYSSDVLSTFSNFKLESSGSQKGGIDLSREYFAKFLTSQKLLKLQLGDRTFRRFFLVQFLVLFRYLTSSVKFKNKEVQVLNDDQNEWVKETELRVIKLLEETPPDGSTFTKTIIRILKREEQWSSWKNSGCPEFKAPVEKVDSTEPAPSAPKTRRKAKAQKRRLGDEMREYDATNKFAAARSDLARLWHLTPNNLLACKSKDRDFLPPLETYFDVDPQAVSDGKATDAGIPPSRYADSNYGWRALRLLSRRSLNFFMPGANNIVLLPDYLDTMAKKIQQENQAAAANVTIDIQDADTAVVMDSGVNGTEEEEEGLLQEEDKKIDSPDEDGSQSNPHEITAPTPEELLQLAEALGEDWKLLAPKLGYREDEILFMEQEKPTVVERGHYMLQLWNEEESDVADLLYQLSAAGLLSRAEGIFPIPED